jgi:predicted dehydrogenase
MAGYRLCCQGVNRNLLRLKNGKGEVDRMLRMAIFGSGGMAEYHATKFSSVPGCTVTAACDHRSDHAKAFAARLGISPAFDSMDALLDWGKFDALSCAVIDGKHRQVVDVALGRGIPVFCEKPLSRTLADAEAMARVATEAWKTGGTQGAVNFSKRNAPALLALKNAVETELGDIERVEAIYNQDWVSTKGWGDWKTVPRWKWRLSPEESTAGCVGDLGSHLLDALLFVFGKNALRSMGPGTGMGLEEAMARGLVAHESVPRELGFDPAADSASAPGDYNNIRGLPWVDFSAELQLANGAAVDLKTSWIAPSVRVPGAGDDCIIRVQGSRAAAELDLGRSRTSIVLEAGAKSSTLAGPPVVSTYESFIASVRDGQEAFPGFQEGLEVQRLLNDILPGGLPL